MYEVQAMYRKQQNEWYFDSFQYKRGEITKQCVVCKEWIDERELAQDLETDGLICIDCYNEHRMNK